MSLVNHWTWLNTLESISSNCVNGMQKYHGMKYMIYWNSASNIHRKEHHNLHRRRKGSMISYQGKALHTESSMVSSHRYRIFKKQIEVEERANSSKHIRKAIELMANRNNPDYENVIKESISAVEYEVREAKGEEIVRGLEKLALHPQLAQAWKNMYHWASQEPGVRHANTEESKVGMAEARYVLIAASAFVNYLKLKGQQ